MVVFNDPVPVENPAMQAVLMALEMRETIGALIEKWSGWGTILASALELHMALQRSAPLASKAVLTMPQLEQYPTSHPAYVMKPNQVKS